MSGIPPNIVFAVNQIEVVFADDIGNIRRIRGTGFWVSKGETHYFVTNAHNIEPRMKLGSDTRYEISKFSINLRFNQLGAWHNKTQFCEVKLHKTDFGEVDPIKKHLFADVAALRAPVFTDKPEGYGYNHFDIGEIADKQWFHENIQMMDSASFIGFPGANGVNWYDEYWNLGISRTVNIASYPQIGFNNSQIPTSDAILVSGLSFSGSSGSAVISHEKVPRITPMPDSGKYVPPKLIGIMSGHFNEKSESGSFHHGGLSYFTASTAILDVLV